MSASSTTSQLPLPSSPPSAWRSKARCRSRARGWTAALIGEVAQYEDEYRLSYMRGPAGIIVALAEELV